MTLAEPIWKKCIPKGLLSTYKRHVRQLREAPICRGKQEEELKAMMESIRITMGGAKHTRALASTTAFLKPKNATKCRLLLNATAINRADRRRPRKFKLPSLEGLGREMATRRASGTKMYLTKVDLTNCYWAIRLPTRWRRIFTIQVQNTKYRVTRLPFGWKFSPSVCQMLVERLARAATEKGEGLPKTYLDDMLLQRGARKESKRATRRLTRKLTQAGFIISPKSDLRPRISIDFVGKIMS